MNIIARMKRLTLLACLALFGLCAGAWAQTQAPGASQVELSAEDAALVIATGPGGDITAADVSAMADAQVPVDRRALFWGTPSMVAKYARNLYAYRALASRAEAAGLEIAESDAQGPRMLRDRAYTEAYLRQRAQEAMPDDKAVRAYARSEYTAHPERFEVGEQVHIRHILLRTSPAASDAEQEAVRVRAQELRDQLDDGADFAALAAEHSEDAATADQGGDLGFFDRGRMVAPVDQAAFALQKPGERVGPVHSEFGWHIIELVERTPARRQSLDEVLPQLRSRLEAHVNQRERRELWDGVNNEVEINEENIRILSAVHLNAL